MDTPLGYYNPNLRKQGEKSRKLASERSARLTAEQDPRTYGFVSGLMGEDYGSSPISVLDPKRAKSQKAQDVGMAVGTALETIPGLAALRKPAVKTAKAVGTSALKAVNDANLYGDGFLGPLTPKVNYAVEPGPKFSSITEKSPHGRGWWYNTDNKKLLPIDSGSLGPHGDHDGWISVGDNAAKLGVDPKVALRYQEGTYGFMVPKEEVQKAIKRGEISPTDSTIDKKTGEYYYNENYGDQVPTFAEAFEKKHGMGMEEASMSGLPEELSSLVRIRQWPNGRITYSLHKEPDSATLQGIVNTMDQIPGFWKAPKVIALLDDGASAYTLSPENFSRVRNLKDLPRFNDDVLAKSSEVAQVAKAETPPPVSPLESVSPKTLSAAEREANLKNFLDPSVEKGYWYHGTAEDVPYFDPSRSLEKPGQAEALFVSDTPRLPEKFAKDSIDYMKQFPDKYLTPEQKQRALEDTKKYFKDTYSSDELTAGHADQMIKSLESGNPEGEALDELHNAYKNYLPSGPNIMKLHVQVQNPFDPKVPEHVEKLRQLNPDLPFDEIGRTSVMETPEVQKAIKDAQFDAFYTSEDGARNLGIFDPNRVKSATGNVGTYDTSNRYINKKAGGSVKRSRYSRSNAQR